MANVVVKFNKNLGSDLEKAQLAALRAAADDTAVPRAKRLGPKDTGEHVRSIEIIEEGKDDEGVFVRFGATKAYSEYAERGGGRSKRSPKRRSITKAGAAAQKVVPELLKEEANKIK